MHTQVKCITYELVVKKRKMLFTLIDFCGNITTIRNLPSKSEDMYYSSASYLLEIHNFFVDLVVPSLEETIKHVKPYAVGKSCSTLNQNNKQVVIEYKLY